MMNFAARALRGLAWLRAALAALGVLAVCVAHAAGLPAPLHVDLAWQPVPAAGARLPLQGAWRAMDASRVTGIDRGPRGAWLRVAPAPGLRWPAGGLSLELRLRALGDVTLVDARGADATTVSLDRDPAGAPRGHGVTLVTVPPADDPTAPVLLRLEPHDGAPAAIDVIARATPDEAAADGHRLAAISACLAVMLCTAVYALLFGVLMHDVTYIHYAAYVLGFAGIQAISTGFVVDPLGLESLPPMRAALMAVAVGVSSWGAALFLCGFADLPRYAPRFARALTWSGNSLLALCALTLLPTASLLPLLQALINPWLIVLALLMLAASVTALRRGSRYVPFYLIGWAPLLVATVIDSAQSFGAFATWTRTAEAMLAAGTFETVVLVFAITFRARDLRSDRDRTRREAETDALTGVLNRMGWQRHVDLAMMRARQRREPVALMFLDLDHFKAFNDRHGHASGDELLKLVAQAIGRELRPADLVGRYGGEEFVTMLPGCNGPRARATAERVRARVEQLRVPVRDGLAGTTVSIGISALDPDEEPHAAVARADAAMYQAKRTGRNRTRWSPHGR
jgi:diguanylate cyclase (GGDEF)-like protein